MDDSVQDGYVYITTAEQADGLLALDGHFVEHRCCYGYGTCTFHHHLLLLYDGQDGCADFVLGNGDNAIQILAAHFICKVTRLLHGNTISHGAYIRQALDMSICHTLIHARSTSGLHAPHLYRGIETLDGKGNATGKSTATDGHYYALHIGQLFQQFKTDCALASNYVFVVEGMYKGIAMLISQF